MKLTTANPVLCDLISSEMPPGFTVYRIQDRWARRRGVIVRRATRPWRRTWQCEWDHCRRAQRGWTRNGAIVRGVRAAIREWERSQ